MNRHAVILGTIRWIAREFAGRTPQFSPARVMLSSAEFLARSAPEAAAATKDYGLGTFILGPDRKA